MIWLGRCEEGGREEVGGGGVVDRSAVSLGDRGAVYKHDLSVPPHPPPPHNLPRPSSPHTPPMVGVISDFSKSTIIVCSIAYKF